MWNVIKYQLTKIWRAFEEWRDDNDISWGHLIGCTVVSIGCLLFVFMICSSIKGCLNNLDKQQKIEAAEQSTREKVSYSDHIRKGDKIKVTIQTKDGPQSFDGIFVDRYSDIIAIKTDKGRMVFGGSFVIEEIK